MAISKVGSRANSRLHLEQLESRQMLAVTFNLNFIGGNSIVFNDPAEGTTRQMALQRAADDFGKIFNHTATIDLDVVSIEFDPATRALADAGTNFGNSPPASGSFYRGVVGTKIITGNDPNGSIADGNIRVAIDPTSPYNFTTGPTSNNQIDFSALVTHELMHAVGFLSGIAADGDDNWSASNTGDPNSTWNIYDQFLVAPNGDPLINTANFQIDLNSWTQNSVGGTMPGTLFFNGPNAVAANGSQPVELYTPTTFIPGSNASHLNTDSPQFSDQTHSMVHSLSPGLIAQRLHPLEFAMLRDLGFDVIDPSTVPLVVDDPGDANDGDFSAGNLTLREAISLANDGDGDESITFAESLFAGGAVTISVSTEMSITESVTIMGPSNQTLTLDAGGNSRIFLIDDGDNTTLSDVSISNLTMQNGSATYGGAISTMENLTVSNSTLTGNTSTMPSPNYYNGGGAIQGNLGAGTVTVIGSMVNNNSSAFQGGGIVGFDLIIQNTTVSGNTAAHGGGLGAFNNITVTDSTLTGNSATGYYSYASLVTYGGLGGGIASFAGLTLTNSTLSGNSAIYSGGGAAVVSGGITANSSTVDGNSAYGYGGGLYAFGDIALDGSTISANVVASALSGGGGGIATIGNATINQSTISGNSASNANGGGISASGSATIALSTIAFNSAYAGGGGLHAANGAVAISNSIMAMNQSGYALDLVAPNMTLAFTLVGDNAGTNLTEAQTADANGNLIGSSAGTGIIDPLLFPLAGNGGATQTHNLQSTSPAVDAGDPAAMAGIGNIPQVDQRGNVRVFNIIDMGAVEALELPTSFVVSTIADESDGDFSDGDFSLREAIELTNLTDAAEDITFSALFDSDQTITLGSELLIAGPSMISGPEGSDLTLDAGGTSFRVLRIDDADNGSQSEVAISNLSFTGGVAGYGGAIATMENLTLTNATVSGNTATNENSIYDSGGGGVWAGNNARISIANSSINGNSANYNGGGVFSDEGTLNIQNSTISQNQSNRQGGGVFNQGNQATIELSTINENSAASSGGGVSSITGSLSVTNTSIQGNSSVASGGGIFSFALTSTGPALSVTNSTISGNSTSADFGYGGAIYAYDLLQVTSSTISGNSTMGDQSTGAAILFVREASIAYSTIVNNSAAMGSDGAFGSNNSGAITVSNSIIANNQNRGYPSEFGPGVATLTINYSLIGTAEGLTINGNQGNLTGTNSDPLDPLLGALSDNGGATMTHAPLANSPALDAGMANPSNAPDFDQRGSGFNRIVGSAIDMGALELLASWHNSENPVDVNGDGVVAPNDINTIITELVLGNFSDDGGLLIDAASPPPFYDVNDDGFVAPDDIIRIINFLIMQNQSPMAPGSESDSAIPVQQVENDDDSQRQLLSKDEFPSHRIGNQSNLPSRFESNPLIQEADFEIGRRRQLDRASEAVHTLDAAFASLFNWGSP